MSKATVLIPKFAQLLRTTCCLSWQARGHHTNISSTINTVHIHINQRKQFNGLLLSARTCIKRRGSTEPARNETKGQAKAYLNEMGFDTQKIEDKRPSILKGNLNKIQSNIQFFRQLNLEDKTIQSIVSRQPNLLSVSLDHLREHVLILQEYNLTDEQIGQVVSRAPKFFGVPITTVQGNIRYVKWLGVTKKKIHTILFHYPTTFSRKINGVEMVGTQISDILKAHVTMDDEFARNMIRSMVMTTPKLFIRSPGEIVRNISYLESLGFTGRPLYTIVRFCPETLRVYPSYVQKKFDFVQQLFSLDGPETVKLLTRFPKFINFQPKLLQLKADNFQSLGFTLEQIRDQPRAFAFSVETFTRRYESLKRAGYVFKTMRLLTLSEKQIEAEVRKLTQGLI